MGKMGWSRESLGVQKKALKKSFIRKVFNYLSSDTYMYAPILSRSADPESDVIFFPSTEPSDSNSSSAPLETDERSLHDFEEQSIPHDANAGGLAVPQDASKAFTNESEVDLEAKCDVIQKNLVGGINPQNIHSMITRSKSGALAYKPMEASTPTISSTPSTSERTSAKAIEGNSHRHQQKL